MTQDDNIAPLTVEQVESLVHSEDKTPTFTFSIMDGFDLAFNRLVCEIVPDATVTFRQSRDKGPITFHDYDVSIPRPGKSLILLRSALEYSGICSGVRQLPPRSMSV
jgi:hypothetical protein